MINIHRINPENCGDMKCSPVEYFDFQIKVEKVCIEKLSRGDNLGADNMIILGGGGLFFNPWISTIKKIVENYPSIIGWGVGINTPKKTYPEFVKKFKLFGTRDYIDGYRWVPCVSCMDKIFDNNYETKHEKIVYEHKEHYLHAPNLPKKQNNSSFDDAIKFLASGETVVTNTYHGAYWATLLRKKVIVIPVEQSSRFDFFKHKPNLGVSYDCLEECREANRKFYKDVMESLNQKVLL